jgi:hypothetical protein
MSIHSPPTMLRNMLQGPHSNQPKHNHQPRAGMQRVNVESRGTKSRKSKKASPGRRNRVSQAGWTPEEDAVLTTVVNKQKGRNWKLIASYLKNRKPEQCLHRWQKVLNPTLTKGLWTPDEDRELEKLVQRYEPKRWSLIASHLAGRNGKQCRERWHNHLDPTINKQPFTKQEDQILLEAHASVGNKWALIASLLPGRTHNAVKNRWHSSLKHFCTPAEENMLGGVRSSNLNISSHNSDYYLNDGDTSNSGTSSSSSSDTEDGGPASSTGTKRKRSNSVPKHNFSAKRMAGRDGGYTRSWFAEEMLAEARDYLDNWR